MVPIATSDDTSNPQTRQPLWELQKETSAQTKEFNTYCAWRQMISFFCHGGDEFLQLPFSCLGLWSAIITLGTTISPLCMAFKPYQGSKLPAALVKQVFYPSLAILGGGSLGWRALLLMVTETTFEQHYPERIMVENKVALKILEY